MSLVGEDFPCRRIVCCRKAKLAEEHASLMPHRRRDIIPGTRAGLRRPQIRRPVVLNVGNAGRVIKHSISQLMPGHPGIVSFSSPVASCSPDN